MPETDFVELGRELFASQPDLMTNGSHFYSDKPCSFLSLHNLTFTIGGLDYHIP
jgi:hypothetical protein